MRNANDVIDAKSTLPERIADSMVQFGGSWTFIIGFLILSSIYTAINVVMRKAAWDPYPFILLNLILSLLAAIQAPVIMMSQNRQDMKDRVRGELDYAVNRRSERPYPWWSALILALTGLVFLWVDVAAPLQRPLPFLLAGGWLLAQGVCRLVSYLRMNPYPHTAEGVRA